MKTKLLLPLALVGLSLTACQDYDFGYKSYEPDKANTDYSLRFVNRDEVNVNINTATPGAPYFIYFNNPYDAEGNFNGEMPYLQGRTPIEATLSVPRHVKSLYVVSPMRSMRVLPAGDVNIQDPNLFQEASVTRVNTATPPYDLPTEGTAPYKYRTDVDPVIGGNPDITDGVMNYVNSCFPSGQRNISEDQVDKNTDLSTPTEAGQEYMAIWITYLGKGENDPDCHIWFYIYKDDPNQLTMYGRDNSGLITEVTWNKGKPNLEQPLIASEGIQQIPQTLFLGYIKSGYNIGFCYQTADARAQAAKSRFTTPSLNEQTVQGSGKTGGVIINKEIDGHEYNFVGFERVADKQNGQGILADYDFNDALLCVETNPTMKPKEDVPVDPVIEKITTKGYYLFEDLYDAEHKGYNDNDFNDVVVYYEKSIYNLGSNDAPQWMCDFSVDLLAHACENTNTIGVYHKAAEATPRTFSLITGINGLENMETAPAYDGSGERQITFSLTSDADVVLPYLRTTKSGDTEVEFDPTNPNEHNIYATTYATGDYPYAIEIPFSENSFFRWMKEGLEIKKGYTNWNTGDWYIAPSNPENVVPRTEGTLY